MAELRSLAELGHLRRELDVDEPGLGFLAEHASDDVRRLRFAIAESLAARHRSTFVGMAKASKLLPKAILPTVAEKAVGPLVCSKIAAEIEPGYARRIVGAFAVPFLADLCGTLDTVSAAPVIGAIPAKKAVPVGVELRDRGDYETLGRFIDVVDFSVIPPMLEKVDDDDLLRIAIVAESRERLTEVFATLDDSRIRSLVEAAVAADLLDEALVMVSELDAVQVTRVVEVVVESGDLLLTDLVAAIADLGAWDRLLPVIAGLDPDAVAAVASAPVLRRPDVFDSLVAHVDAAGAVDDFVALVDSLPEDSQRELAAAVAEGSPENAARLVDLADERGVGQDLPALATLRETRNPTN